MSAFYTCPAGHHERLAYETTVPVTSWCEACHKPVLFTPVTAETPTPQSEDENRRGIEFHIANRFKEFAATIDQRNRGGKPVFDAEPQNDAHAIIIARLRLAGFPERHIARLPTMDAYGSQRAREADAVLQSRPGPAACLLWGDYGRGKTQVAVGIGMLRAARGERTRYISAVDLIRELKSTFTQKIPEAAFLRRFHECQCLILDDVHAALDDDPAAVKWTRGQIQGILDTRYRSNLPRKTVLISNAPDSAALNYRLGGHILSRVAEDGEIIHLNTKNYRTP